MALKRAGLFASELPPRVLARAAPATRLGGGELGHRLGALGHGVLGQLAGQGQAHRGLDLAGGQGGLLVVAHQLRGLAHHLVEDVVDEGVHHRHALLGDARLCDGGEGRGKGGGGREGREKRR